LLINVIFEPSRDNAGLESDKVSVVSFVILLPSSFIEYISKLPDLLDEKYMSFVVGVCVGVYVDVFVFVNVSVFVGEFVEVCV